MGPTYISFELKILLQGNTEMDRKQILKRITNNPDICGGKPCIRDTRIPIAVILDGLAEGLNPEQLMDHYPQLVLDDIHAALAYAADLSQENIWKVAASS
jgi:uncharacterized protein (DUF433 family)